MMNWDAEVDVVVIGGVMGEVADATYLQMKTLNSSKGPAIRALRAQSDKKEYMRYMRNLIEKEENIDIKQCTVCELIVENGEVKGITSSLFSNILRSCKFLAMHIL